MSANTDLDQALEKAKAKLRDNDPQVAFEKAMAELSHTQQRLREVREELQGKPTKVTSKDHMVTVVLDERGDLRSITFNNTKYRQMAPAELGSVLVEAITKARAAGRTQMARAFQPLMPEGLDIEQLMAGNFSVDGIFERARRRSEQIAADGQPVIPAIPPNGRS